MAAATTLSTLRPGRGPLVGRLWSRQSSGRLRAGLRPNGGRALVAGYDVVHQAAQVRYHIGLLGQHTAVDEVLSGRQNLVLFGRLHHLGAVAAGRPADQLLERFGLAGTGGKTVKQYSGGMRRRST